jgi:hypothetical protein
LQRLLLPERHDMVQRIPLVPCWSVFRRADYGEPAVPLANRHVTLLRPCIDFEHLVGTAMNTVTLSARAAKLIHDATQQ